MINIYDVIKPELKSSFNERLVGFGLYSVVSLLEGAFKFIYHTTSMKKNEILKEKSLYWFSQGKAMKQMAAGMVTSNNHLYQKGAEKIEMPGVEQN